MYYYIIKGLLHEYWSILFLAIYHIALASCSGQYSCNNFWHITWTRPHYYHYYTECLIVQVICQNITVPNITTYTKYNNIFYVNLHGNPAYSLVYKNVTF